MINIAINGFGRIGRTILRNYFLNEKFRKEINIVAINDLADADTLTHLLKYDSTHGRFESENIKVTLENEKIKINETYITLLKERDPTLLPWKKLNIDIVLECSGFFTDGHQAQKHITAGAKKVLISAPAKNVNKTIVFGVNEHTLTKEDILVSNASCTTNALAPVAKIVDNLFGIKKGIITTIHAYTGDQKLLDAPHGDLFRARSAADSMIPTKTGAAVAVAEVLPHLKGKLDGMAMRVPTNNVSVVDLVCQLDKGASIEEIHKELKKASEGELKGILGYNSESLVSIDYLGRAESSIFDSTQSISLGNGFVKLFMWYDNEWGFSNRMLDTSISMGKKI